MVLRKIAHIAIEIYNFYINGFRNMVLGKTLWKLILIKLVVIFFILRLFFFPNYLKSRFSNDHQRSQHVLEQLTQP